MSLRQALRRKFIGISFGVWLALITLAGCSGAALSSLMATGSEIGVPWSRSIAPDERISETPGYGDGAPALGRQPVGIWNAIVNGASTAARMFEPPEFLGLPAGGLLIATGTGLGLIGALAIVFIRASRRSRLHLPQRIDTGTAEEGGSGQGEPEPRDLFAELHSLGAEIRRQIGDLSHEMRTPLAVIAGSANAVRRELPQEAQKGRRSADLIALSAERLVDLLDAHREQTDQLLDSFLGSQVTIDVGAFVQNFIVHARVSSHVSSVHPPHALYARTQAGSLKEILGHLLVEAETGVEPNRKTLSLAKEGDWIQIIIKYYSPDLSRPLAIVPGVEFALSGQRVRLSLMGARLQRTLDKTGIPCLTLALPAEILPGP